MNEMTMKEAMYKRHMVRKYQDLPLPEENVHKLRERIREQNRKNDLAIQLMVDDASAFSALIRLILAKGVKNYFIMAGQAGPDLDERLGYAGADLMLYAQTLGLNTWWVGGTFNRKKMSELMPGKRVAGVVAVGYGADQGKPHKSKKPEEVSAYDKAAPEWFRNGVEAALLAPTALNKQAFFIRGQGEEVSITCNNGIFTGVDLGLVKYHFALGAKVENFRWKQERKQ